MHFAYLDVYTHDLPRVDPPAIQLWICAGATGWREELEPIRAGPWQVWAEIGGQKCDKPNTILDFSRIGWDKSSEISCLLLGLPNKTSFPIEFLNEERSILTSQVLKLLFSPESQAAARVILAVLWYHVSC